MPNNQGSEDRRKNSERDYIMLCEMSNNMKNMVKAFDSHILDIKERLQDHENRVRYLERGFFLGMGALGLLQVGLKFFFK